MHIFDNENNDTSVLPRFSPLRKDIATKIEDRNEFWATTDWFMTVQTHEKTTEGSMHYIALSWKPDSSLYSTLFFSDCIHKTLKMIQLPL